jgi:hypothetical protein
MAKSKNYTLPLPTEPQTPAGPKDFNTRTQHLCQILEDRIASGDLRLGFSDYIRLLQWREKKGFDKPAKTIVTWADPWWLGKIGEMEEHADVKAVLEKFRAEGITQRTYAAEKLARERKP